MILLEPGNRILAETIAAQLKPPAESVDPEDGKAREREPIDVRLCDFDDVVYHVVLDTNDRNSLSVSMNLPVFTHIKDRGAQAAIEKVYGSLVTEAEPGYDVTLKIDLANLTMKPDELVNKVKLLKATVIGGAFDHFFDPLLAGKPLTESFHFNLRQDTQIYLIPRSDRVIIIYGIDFRDKVDAAIARVFMAEFVDARRRISAAPPCTFSVNPPLELKEFGITEPTGNLGFVSFAVMKSHVDGGRKDKVVGVLQSFRTYVQYHIKCSKAYFHSRMRARVMSLLKVLNRAKQEAPTGQKEMKTIQGKTFKRTNDNM